MDGPLLAMLVLIAGVLAWLAFEIRAVHADVKTIMSSALGRTLLT